MKIKRIKKIKINCFDFKVEWDKTHNGGSFSYCSFSYSGNTINIGVKKSSDNEIFMVICHELMEICALELNIRFNRPDCDSDYLFSYDHRQHETMMNMFAGLLSQFIGERNE